MNSLRILLGGGITAVILALAAISLVWTPYAPTGIDIIHRLAAPSAAHPFGTDPFGRDVLSMIMVGAQNSLAVSAVAVALGCAIGIPAGLIAAARRG